MTEPDLVERVRAAMESADIDAMRDLLAPDARWGAPGDPEPPCQNRGQVLSWYEAGRAAGMRAKILEAFTVGASAIVIGMTVTGRPGHDGQSSGQDPRWQVLTIRDNKIAAITGFDARQAALTHATTL